MPAIVLHALTLALFVLVAYGHRLWLPFVGDDYVFLDKTRHAPFASLWGASSTEFGWYRPLSREVYFWLLQHLYGADARAFRYCNIASWIVALCLYAAIVARVATPRAATIAVAGVASLAFWGTPLLWVSGSQELLMLVFALLSVLMVLEGRVFWAVPALAAALLCKETAAVVPAIILLYLRVIRRVTWPRLLVVAAVLFGVLGIWALLHPTLEARMLGRLVNPDELQSRPMWLVTLAKAMGTAVNLAQWPRPQDLDAEVVLRTAVSVLVLAGSVVWAYRRHGQCPGETPRARRGPLALSAGWAATGFVPLLLPSIGWHAYYGCLGVLGLWLGIAVWLETRPAIAIAVVALLAVLRGADANTLSSDWGDETYFVHAGSALSEVRADLKRQHPTFPSHSRVYFANIPYHIGLVAGNSPALRVWYGDSTLGAAYYSSYRPRAPEQRAGSDYFFRFDSTGMIEVKVGAEDVDAGRRGNPMWASDHTGLALTLLGGGDPKRAAVEFEKVSRVRTRPDAAIYAAACHDWCGEKAVADSLIDAARARTGVSNERMLQFVSHVEGLLRGYRRPVVAAQ